MKRYIQTIFLLFFVNISYGQELPSWSKGISHSNYVGKIDIVTLKTQIHIRF